MNLFREEANGLYERICNYAMDVDLDLGSSPNAADFARFCTYLDFLELREHGGGERWSREGSRERLALKFFLAKAIAISTPDAHNIPECYVRFASGLTTRDVVITFNWDVLLENSLVSAGIPFSYRHKEGSLQILKLHGSINWIEGPPKPMARNSRDYSYRAIGYAGGLNEVEVFCSDLLRNPNEWRGVRCLIEEVKPLLVLPGYGKAVDVRLLSSIWYRPEFLNLLGGGVSIIGLSVAEDDYIVESLFRYLIRATFSDTKRLVILNPDPVVGEKFQALAGKDRFVEFLSERFEIASVEKALLKK